VVSFHQVFPPKPCINLSCPPYVPHTPPISLYLTYLNNIWCGACVHFLLLQFRTVINFKDNLRNIDRCEIGICNLWERLVPKIWRLPVITIHTKSETSNLIGGLLTDITKYTVSFVQVSNYSNTDSLKFAFFVLSVHTQDFRSLH
jgi:hypothetical protein